MARVVTVRWCGKQSRGIRIIEPNETLAKEYLRAAEESLDALRAVGEMRMWEATIGYYCRYFAVYAMLLRLGIRCEIHECTIALVSALEKTGVFPAGTSRSLEQEKDLRIDNQYYLRNRAPTTRPDEIGAYILAIRERIDCVTAEDCTRVRDAIRSARRARSR